MKLSEAKKLSAQVVRAEIEGTVMSHDGKKEFVIYIVKCTTRDGHGWQCRKRFSEFVSLKAEMEMSGCPGVEEVKLPPKRVLRANGARVVEERVAGLQEFHRNAIRASNKRHVSIARWAINRDSQFFEVRTERIDIIDSVCEVAKISTDSVILWIPVVG